jgi:hypothetical protein
LSRDDAHDALLDPLVLARVLVADRDDRGVAHERAREPLDLTARHRWRWWCVTRDGSADPRVTPLDPWP